MATAFLATVIPWRSLLGLVKTNSRPVGGREMHIEELHGGELLRTTHGVGPRARCLRSCFKVDVQAIRHEGGEDVRLDVLLVSMMDCLDREGRLSNP
jgi:hypothetical protein